ncbi:MAG: response regulator transcription factor [Endomicrobiaceae bacterium]|nr:response regulator transcription factor [Endomicrobiaceae bacterium]
MEQKKILIIDDDESFLETFALILTDEGFQVFKATTAESGFEALVVSKPDLVILDKNLPDKSGYDVLIFMKRSKDFSSVPVMLITADTAVLVDEAFERGADDCIFKPINQQEIIGRIKKLLI